MDRLTKRYIPNDEKSGISGVEVFESENKIPLVKVLSGEYLYPAIEKLATYEDLEEQGLLVRLPCKVGDIVYVDSTMLPIEDMECYEDIDNKIPSYFQGRVVSFRFAQRNWAKIAVKAKWLYEWIDDETGPESDYIECEKNFSILLSTIGKTVFLTHEEAEKKLEEMKNE